MKTDSEHVTWSEGILQEIEYGMDLKDAARYYGVLAIAGMGVVGSTKNEATSNSGLITRVGTCRGRSQRHPSGRFAPAGT